MLSVIFYGRNDNHGYNLHKRASLSLNNVAELLTHEDDEVLFVDWNTPPGLPTFVESIHDLLTDRAKKLIKIIKVDASIHQELYAGKTNKQTIEPVARNVAIVRSNPKNRWILSTNTDMIFIPKDQSKSLSKICEDLEDGFYELPRFSLPEILWETFDRLDPNLVMNQLLQLRTEIDLDEVVASGPILKFDAPGDFQLCLRSQLFEINGFDETMILGWHVDSNLCRRLNILNGETKSLDDQLLGYHCEHTKTATHFTSSGVQNDLVKYFENTTASIWNFNYSDWGLQNFEIPIDSVNHKISKRLDLLKSFAEAPNKIRGSIYANSMGRLAGYPATHAAPYVADAIYDLPKNSRIIYIGNNDLNFDIYSKMIRQQNKIEIERFSEKTMLNFEKYLQDTNPKFIILDLGFDVPEEFVSDYTHSDFNNLYLTDLEETVAKFLDLFIGHYKVKKIYDTTIITLNAETYDLGTGTSLKRWLHLPQVASNSRVRIAKFRKNLFNRNEKTLIRLKKRTTAEITILKSANKANLTLNRSMLDRQGLQLTSHQITPYAKSFEGIAITPRGTMIRNSGEILFDLSDINFNEETISIVEIDRPRADANRGTISGDFSLQGVASTLFFRSEFNECDLISTNLSRTPKELALRFSNLRYPYGQKFSLRITNFGIFYKSRLERKMIIKLSSDLSSRYFLKDNFSYSKEGNCRWTTNNYFTLENFDKYNNLSRLIILEILHYKDCGKEDLLESISLLDNSLLNSWFEIPRLSRRRGRLLFIYIPKDIISSLKLNLKTNPYAPYELGRLESRTLSVRLGSISISYGLYRIFISLLLFPLFIIWKKMFGGRILRLINKIHFRSKTFI